MIQCRFSNLPTVNERETVLLMLIGLRDHSTYRTATTNMFGYDLFISNSAVKERLEAHTLMIEEATNNLTREMPRTNKNETERIFDDIYNACQS